MPECKSEQADESFEEVFSNATTKDDEEFSQLEKQLEYEKDARQEERFIFVVIIILLLDVVFFSLMPNLSGPLALLILQLLILVPLARRMGIEEIALIVERVLGRVANGAKRGDD